MRELAEDFVEHFDFDFGGDGMTASLAEDAPGALRAMVDDLCPGRAPECMAQLFEALTTISEADDGACTPGEDTEVDEKICSLEFCLQVLDRLQAIERED